MQHPERQQLWMVWLEARLKGPVDPKIPDGYFIRTYQTGDDRSFIALMALMDFDPWTQGKLDYNLSRILPEGYGTMLARNWIGRTRLKNGPTKSRERTTGSDERLF